MPSRFRTKYQIHQDSTPLINLNTGKWKEREGPGEGGGGFTASFKYAFSLLSYDWTLFPQEKLYLHAMEH